MINLTKMLELTIAGKEDGKKLLQLEDMLKQYIIEQTVKSKGGNKELQRLTAGRNDDEAYKKSDEIIKKRYGKHSNKYDVCIMHKWSA